VIYVDDGSSDGTAAALAELAATRPWLRVVTPRAVLRPERRGAQRRAAASPLRTIVATLDGDGQNDPAFIPAMLAAARGGRGLGGLVQGQRVGRKDTGFKRMQSRIANKVRGAILKDGTRDTGCGLKCFRREAYLALPYFDALHRFMPALDRARGLHGPASRRARPAAHDRRLELRLLRPALGRHPRPRRRLVADPAPQARAADRDLDGGALMLIDLQNMIGDYFHDVFVNNVDWWVLLGVVAQGLFTMRFVVQWLASEKAQRSVVPMTFWWFSIGGGALLLVYALYRRDPVFILGQGFGGVRLSAQPAIRAARQGARRGYTNSGGPGVTAMRRHTSQASAPRNRRSFSRRSQPCKAGVEVFLEVLEVLEPDMQADRRALRSRAWSPCGRAVQSKGRTRLS
jgi:lipid-A-disaccharide synthase-like uncharacterized protein